MIQAAPAKAHNPSRKWRESADSAVHAVQASRLKIGTQYYQLQQWNISMDTQQQQQLTYATPDFTYPAAALWDHQVISATNLILQKIA